MAVVFQHLAENYVNKVKMIITIVISLDSIESELHMMILTIIMTILVAIM